MKKYLSLIVIMFFILLVSGCGRVRNQRQRSQSGSEFQMSTPSRKSSRNVSFRNPLAELRRFCRELEKNGDSYTVYEWAEAAERYNQIEMALLEYHYTDEEHKEIGYLEGKCAGYLARGVKNGEEKAEIRMEAAERGFNEVTSDIEW